ncbi:MAG: hypothetical protein ACRCTS_09610 [Fusobacteriaceae bacterium]
MKKLLSVIFLFLFFFSCTKKEEKTSLLWGLFPDSNITYSGGFENSNYTVITKKYSKDITVQKIETTATIVTKAIKITEDSATVVFLGENVENYNEDMNNLERILIKLPLEKDNSWESDENFFKIKSYDNKTLIISRKFDDTEIETIYETGIGMVHETFSSEGFEKISKIIEKKPI